MAYSEALAKELTKLLEVTGIKRVTTTKKPYHVRASIDKAGFEAELSKYSEFQEVPSSESLSGTYATFAYSLKKPFSKFKKGDVFYFVGTRNKQSGGIIPTKLLTPDNLGFAFANNKHSKLDFLRTIEKNVDEIDVPQYIKSFLIEFANVSKTGGKLTSAKDINESDIKTVAKDFGEIATAYHALYGIPDAKYIEFPSQSNQKLIDFWVHLSSGGKIPVSVKSFGGAAPSLKSIVEAARQGKFAREYELPRKFILAVNDHDGKDGIIQAAKIVDHNSHDIVKREFMSGKDYNNAALETMLANLFAKRTDSQIYEELEEKLYSKIGRGLGAKNKAVATISEIRKLSAKSGLILSPMAYSVVDLINKKQEYTNFLNLILNQFDVVQIFVSINKTTGEVSFVRKNFEQSDFKYEYHSNAKLPGNNKIGFEMVK